MTQTKPSRPSNGTIGRPPALQQSNDSTDSDQLQRRNHLQSLLIAALDDYFVYPSLARRQGWQGRVEVSLRVDADGRFSQLRVLHSSGYAALDQDALQTLARIGQLQQTPLREGEVMQVRLPIVYRLLEG